MVFAVHVGRRGGGGAGVVVRFVGAAGAGHGDVGAAVLVRAVRHEGVHRERARGVGDGLPRVDGATSQGSCGVINTY